jgi:hypothetical protein|tara:strand:+ start:160 stop:474 length:315 start_codon:yes stop_codon:yes gene_type:complete
MEELKQSIKMYNNQGIGKLPRVNKTILINFIINIDNNKIFPSSDSANYNERGHHDNLKKDGNYPLLKDGKISKHKMRNIKIDTIASYVNIYIQNDLAFLEMLFI